MSTLMKIYRGFMLIQIKGNDILILRYLFVYDDFVRCKYVYLYLPTGILQCINIIITLFGKSMRPFNARSFI